MGFVDKLSYEEAVDRLQKYIKTFGKHKVVAETIYKVMAVTGEKRELHVIDEKSDNGRTGYIVYGGMVVRVNDPIEYMRLKKFVFYKPDEEEEDG